MRYAIFGDIHGYMSEYSAVIDAIRVHKPNHIICLGDIVEGGEFSNQLCDLIRNQSSIRCVRGNHDENNDVILDATNSDWLKNLPTSIEENDCCFTHESPAQPPRKINSEYEAWRALDETEHPLIVVGDSHVSKIYTDSGMTVGEARTVPFVYGEIVHLNRKTRYVISPGAVGYSRDSTHKPKYAILDLDQYTLLIESIEMDTSLNLK